MTAGDIGSVTGLLSIGGLFTALFAGNIAAILGRRKASILTCIPFVVGSLLTGAARSVWEMQIGRFISGLGAGAAIVIVPLYLSEIGPEDLRGMLGFMNQVSINIGILLAQVLGIFFSTYDRWRFILFFGAIIGSIYAITLILFIVESPKWFVSAGQHHSARKSLQYLRDSEDVEDELSTMGSLGTKPDLEDEFSVTPSSGSSTTPSSAGIEESQALLSTEPSNSTPIIPASNVSKPTNIVSVYTFLFSPQYRGQLVVVCGVMIAQQLCGVNSIIFYGVSVLAKLFPELTKTINCIISILNCVVTMYSSTIVDRYGRKQMLIASIAGMGVSAFLLGFGITHSFSILSAVAATLFVIAFATGLGPIPFMIISELVPHNAVGAAQSVGTTSNWLSTFIIGYFFPILQGKIGGYTYYLFVIFCILSIAFVATYIPSSTGSSGSESTSKPSTATSTETSTTTTTTTGEDSVEEQRT